ncbi:RDD family protein [Propionibacteriaceae bacterium Y1923]|uniref:RDD family protein n=1 Tax=Aestuariimicrobium sp. Y1814 TaxID=3418742 RepID=UPI003C14B6E7
MAAVDVETYPGASLGLPETGPGSLAPWRNRVAALIVDWAASMAFAVGAFGMGVLRDSTWRAQTPLLVFFVEASVLTMLMGASFGQLLARIGVARLDGTPVRWWQAVLRTFLKCLVIPVIVVGAERRNLADLMLGTVIVNRR